MKTKKAEKKKYSFIVPLLVGLLVGGLVAVVMKKSDATMRLDRPRAAVSGNKAASGTKKEVIAMERLKRLLETHPRPEIREDMMRYLRERGGYFNLREMLEAPWILGSIGATRVKGRIVPFFEANTDSLVDTSKSDKKWQLVIFHEYQHLLDFVNGVSPEESFLTQDLSRLSEQAVRQMLAGEQRAYLAQCSLAVSLHWEEEFNLCPFYKEGGESALRSVVIETFAMNPQFDAHHDLFLKIASEH